ncbi:MAG: exodeoxyribonuclease VII large subunit [Desulfovibrionaceae bacterium]|nr:exodeoxyribonuclease VII large subunit [Desulfovibrionaceae bacterium]
MDSIFSVRELTERLRQMVEQRFPYAWVRGEVTNLSRPSSGHVYFSLREGDALLGCVWFAGRQKSQERFDPLTGEVWEDGPRPSLALSLENGQEIVCAGRLSVYGPRGAYQMIVDLARESGQGRWYLAFEELKRSLAARGYFDQSRKRPIPDNPRRVALITAPTGAAVRDFIRIASDRGLGSTIRLYPTPVQGEDAPPLIAAALEEASLQGWAQVAVLIRGGGSLQDLWAFNDERVARAIFASRLPVLTGVGHDIDHSIADFVADKAAATPSHTAQLLWPERRICAQRVDDAETALAEAAARRMAHSLRLLEDQERSLALLSPSARLTRQSERLADAAGRLAPALHRLLRERQAGLDTATAALARIDGPDSPERRNSLENSILRFEAAGRQRLTLAEHSLERLFLRLAALSPHAPLERGYALIRGREGRLVRSVSDVATGDMLSLDVRDGSIAARVISAVNEPVSSPSHHNAPAQRAKESP